MDPIQSDVLVISDPEIMGGAQVFAGTRVPLNVVLDSIAAGIDLDRIKASYPFLTDAHIEAARQMRGKARDELVASTREVTELKGMFGPAKKHVSIEAMNAAIAAREDKAK